MPQTLDAFYDQILLGIEDADDQKYAQRALRWTAHAARPISLEELAEAVIIEWETTPCLDIQDRFMDCQALEEILTSGLVSVVRNVIYPAYYSQKHKNKGLFD